MVAEYEGNRREGSNYTLVCNASGHERLNHMSIKYEWIRDGVIHRRVPYYTFNPLTRNDTGNYTCRVTIISPLLDDDVIRQNYFFFNVAGKSCLA